MRNKIVQISLFDTYNSVASSIENSNPELLTLLDEHINFNSFIPIYSRLTDGLGIGRHISLFDDDFKQKYPDIVSCKTDNPCTTWCCFI